MDDVFNDDPSQEQGAVVKGDTGAEQQPLEGQQPPEQQQPAEGAAPPAADTDKHVPLSALEAERKGRQDWKEKAIRFEEEAKQLREQMQRSSQQQPQGQQDPLVTLEQRIVNERFNTSEMVLRSQHQDVDDNVKVFMDAAKQNPALTAQMYAQPHPWKFAYDEGKRLKFAAEIGNDPVAYRKKVEEEIRAELSKSQQPAATALPQSLAGARSAGARGVTFTGPTPIENLFDT